MSQLAIALLLVVATGTAQARTPIDQYERQLGEYDRRVEEQRRHDRQQALVLYVALAALCFLGVSYTIWAVRRNNAARKQNQEFMDRAMAQNEQMIQLLESINERLRGGID